MSNIVKLVVKNVKRVSAAEVDSSGKDVIIIGGDNAQGKSSVIDSIAMALGGERLCPDRPIREGESEASIEVTLDEYVINRRFTRKGSYLKITASSGAKASSPQKLLDGLVGTLSFDPLGFVSMDKEKRTETLRELLGLDFSELDHQRKVFYDRRTAVNRDLADARAMIGSPDPDAPDERISITELMVQLEDIQSKNEKRAGVMLALEEKRRVREKHEDMIFHNSEQIERFKKHIQDLKAKNNEAAGSIVKIDGEIAGIEMTLESTPHLAADPIQEKIKQADELNRKYDFKVKMAEYEADALRLYETSEMLTKNIASIDDTKKRRLREASYPIGGIELGPDGVLYNGIPFEQCSSAEQLRISVAMGFAMNPKLKVILIRDGSLLDEKNLALISEMAKANNGQVWIERVGHGQEATVIIEDGMIKEKEACG